MADPGHITGIDHLVMLARDGQAAWQEGDALFGVGASLVQTSAEMRMALWPARGGALEIGIPEPGPAGDRARAVLGDSDALLASLVFATGDIDAAHRLFARRGLKPGPISEHRARNDRTGGELGWRRFRLDDAEAGGLRMFVIEREARLPRPPGEPSPGGARRLDHLVIETPDPDALLAVLGGRLGLDLRLDRTIEALKIRFLFFRVGEAVLEVVQRLDKPVSHNRFWGVTWEADDLEAARARLARMGREASPVREGRKPGSRVFTLRGAQVPTLFIGHEGRAGG